MNTSDKKFLYHLTTAICAAIMKGSIEAVSSALSAAWDEIQEESYEFKPEWSSSENKKEESNIIGELEHQEYEEEEEIYIEEEEIIESTNMNGQKKEEEEEEEEEDDFDLDFDDL